jgi:murein DD-endopeptidase MepM/ murein hydrolase activator NlpD
VRSPKSCRIAALSVLLCVGLASAAEARPEQQKLVAAIPTQAEHGQRLLIGGRVAGGNKPGRQARLERRRGHRWHRVARSSVRRDGSFSLRWKAPARGAVIRLRVRVIGRGFRLVGRSQVLRLSSAPPAADVLPPAVEHPEGELGALPIEENESDAYSVPEGVGGGDFSSRVPFANAMKLKVTQGQNGGYSHGNNYTRNAIDIAAAAGTPVLAGFSGVIAAVRGGCAPSKSWGCNSGFGNFVYLKHADGTCALHAHLAAINVAAGQQIARYAQLGTVGSSGSSTGAHLHYDRLNCGSRTSLPWSFEEAGQPREGQLITSGNEPPPASAPQPAPQPTPQPQPTQAPRRVITVDNRVTNGMGMREDTTPVRLTTQPWIRCGSRGCNINGTERSSGGQYDAAVCQTTGERTTNGHDTSTADDSNPERFESTRYYGVRLGDGTFGFVSEVWIRAADRGGLGLPAC